MPDPFAKHFAEHERLHKQAVMHDTWGHLFPNESKRGTILFACMTYDHIRVLHEQIDIDGSPWWYETLHEFAFQLDLLKIFEEGDIIKVKCQVLLEKDEEDEDATVLVIHPEQIEKMNFEKDFGWNDVTDKVIKEIKNA